MNNINLSRRRFLQTSALTTGALVIGFQLPLVGRQAQAMVGREGDSVELTNGWLRIDPDNTITIRVASAEMGQGVFTSMPMLIAEELEADWSQVRAEMAPVGEQFTNLTFNMQATGGSTSIRWSFDHLRQIGAQTRELLKAAAAKQWDAAIADCKAEKGYIVHSASGKKLSYGELAAEAAKLELSDKEIPLKPKNEWTLLGTPAKRLDTPFKVNGTAGFGVDVQVDGMLVATIKACPVFGGTLTSVDEAPALAIKGVKQVVPLQDAVAVVADGYWPAKKGLEALQPQWDLGANADNTSDKVSAVLRDGLDREGAVAANIGDASAGIAGAAQTLEAVYEAPLLAHATMEPMNATAHVTADKAELWLPTQGPGIIPGIVAQLTGLQPENVKVHTTFLGGGFGRRFEMDFMIQSVLISKIVGAPVKLIWSREEDMRHDFYRPPSAVKFQAGIDNSGKTVALNTRICTPSIFSRVFPQFIHNGIDHESVVALSDTFYNFANMHADYVMQEVGVPVGFWRSVGSSQNAFFIESFLDEIAHATGRSPVDVRRDLLVDRPRHQAVLDKLLEVSNWGKELPSGRTQGIALYQGYDSIAGEVIEASIGESGEIKMHKVYCVVDCGHAVNPDTIRAQMDSSIIYALTAAFFGEITIKDGAAEQGNFDTYQMLKLVHTPEMETHIIESGEKIGGIGETAAPPAAPALANAIFTATGKRVRSLPLSQHGFKPV